MRWPTRRPTSIRAASSSSTRCRSPAPTRSTSACSPSRSQPEENPKNESRRRPRTWRARPPEFRDRLPRSQARRGRRDRGGEGLLAELPRRLHAPRHARHQGADAGHHGPRRRGRDRRGRPGRHRLEEGRPRAGRSDQPRRGRPDGRDRAWRPGRAVPGARPPAGPDPRRRDASPTPPRCPSPTARRCA